MAKAKDKREALEEWANQFPDLVPWKNQFLIRQNGGLLSGICLNELRDPKVYSPTFFFHNLLVPSPVLTLSYGSSLLSPRGVKKEVKYSAPGESITEFKNQMPISLEPTLANFIYYVLDVKSGKYGVAAVFVPHFFLDVITLGSTGEAYYLGTIERCAKFIETLSNINFNIIGSVAEWKTYVEHYSNLNAEMSIVENSRELKLPELKDGGLQIDVVNDFWELLNK